MGHDHFQVYHDSRTDAEKERDRKAAERKDQIEKNICKAFKCTRRELKIAAEILKESWNYSNY